MPTELPGGLPSDLLMRRPDIRAAEYRLRGANARIGAARAAFFPTISLTGTAGTASASLSGLFEPGAGSWRFLPQITLPIFHGGALRANLEAAHIQKRIEIADYEKVIQEAFREAADGLAGQHTLGEQVLAERRSVEASQNAFDLAELRFQEGVDDYLTLLDTWRMLYGSQQRLVRIRLMQQLNMINLYKALGGGWSEYSVKTPG
ncbi:efflux transporter outer membrane subunit [Salmonella enterica]|nr:efflux transporter outer membrane subunit [Salmonella enterica]EBK4580977.1 RND transporter [Salmonella enterica]